ncbi:uncharacterized protein LOC130744598 [Lotus japonicus]|uniref:uncharacterized protein LOC130744598 n=1 Tax=Lotus japonicus TaxID=34305 RepID=UPI002588A861|nr:uncharacterized protein LOC130744598 [Lotus japonicus]
MDNGFFLVKLSADFELLDVDNGFFLVKFDLEQDKKKVMEGGPWMIFDHYLAVTQWTREFIAPTTKVTTTLVWIRIPGLNATYFDASFLMSVAKLVGTPIRVDMNTLTAERGKFARICVELDLTKPVLGKFWFEGNWFKVVYEGLHIICGSCGCYGHQTRACPGPPPPQVLGPPEQQTLVGALSGGEPPAPSQTLGAVQQEVLETVIEKIQEGITQTVISGEKNREAINKAIIIDDPQILDVACEWLTMKYKPKKKQNKIMTKSVEGPHKGFVPVVGKFDVGFMDSSDNTKKRRKQDAGTGLSSVQDKERGKPSLRDKDSAPTGQSQKTKGRSIASSVKVPGARSSGVTPSSAMAAIGTTSFMQEFNKIDGLSQAGGVFQGRPPYN